METRAESHHRGYEQVKEVTPTGKKWTKEAHRQWRQTNSAPSFPGSASQPRRQPSKPPGGQSCSSCWVLTKQRLAVCLICSDHFPSTLRNRFLPDSCRREASVFSSLGKMPGKMPVYIKPHGRSPLPAFSLEPLLCIQEERPDRFFPLETSPSLLQDNSINTWRNCVPRDIVWETLAQKSDLCRKFPGIPRRRHARVIEAGRLIEHRPE